MQGEGDGAGQQRRDQPQAFNTVLIIPIGKPSSQYKQVTENLFPFIGYLPVGLVTRSLPLHFIFYLQLGKKLLPAYLRNKNGWLHFAWPFTAFTACLRLVAFCGCVWLLFLYVCPVFSLGAFFVRF